IAPGIIGGSFHDSSHSLPTWFHVGRTASRNCNHRRAGGPALARSAIGPRGVPPHQVYEQSEAAWTGNPQFHRRVWPLSKRRLVGMVQRAANFKAELHCGRSMGSERLYCSLHAQRATGQLLHERPEAKRAWSRDNPVRMAQITDGTSNTLLFGEKWLRPNRYLMGDWMDDHNFISSRDPDILRIGDRAPIRDTMNNPGTGQWTPD